MKSNIETLELYDIEYDNLIIRCGDNLDPYGVKPLFIEVNGQGVGINEAQFDEIIAKGLEVFAKY